MGRRKAVGEHHKGAGRPTGRFAVPRPRQGGTIRVGGIAGGDHTNVRFRRAGGPAGHVVGVGETAKPVNDGGGGKLGRAQVGNEVPPEGLAGFFETAQYLVGQGETAKNVFRLDRAPGHHTIAVEPCRSQGDGAGCGVSRGDRTQPPPAGHIGWSLMDDDGMIPAHSPHPPYPA